MKIKLCWICKRELSGRKTRYCGDVCRDAYYRRNGYMLPDWPTISIKILKEYTVCQLCGLAPSVEVHHKIPRRFGGTDERSNLMATCHSCNVRADAIFRKLKNSPQLPLPLDHNNWGKKETLLVQRLF